MSTRPTRAEIDDATRTVTIRQDEYSFTEDTVYPGYHHVVHAATVKMGREFRNPGCDLTVYAGRIVVDPKGARIDVSGVAGAAPPPKPQKATGYIDRKHGAHGANGADGAPGGDAGKVTLVAGRIDGGLLTVVAKGGAGGGAQSGGDGHEGATPEPPSNPGVPQPKFAGWDVQDERHRKPKYVWEENDQIRRIGYEKSPAGHLWVTRSASGHDGGNGGHAGLAGTPGRGGAGGRVVIRALDAGSAPAPKAELTGGGAGAAGEHGTPGASAAGSVGAKYLYMSWAGLAAVDWSPVEDDAGRKNADLDKHWNTKRSGALWSVDHFKNLNVLDEYIVHDGSHKRLKVRAPSGAQGQPGGWGGSGVRPKPAAAEGKPGADGELRREELGLLQEDLAKLPVSYLRMLQRSAHIALMLPDHAEAGALLRWLLAITTAWRTPPETPTAEAAERHRIHQEAEQALLAMSWSAATAPPRCAVTDIKACVEYVEESLGHLSRQEAKYRAFAAAVADGGKQRTALEQAIADASLQIAHMNGDALAPGSIAYLREKEHQTREALGILDQQIGAYATRLQEKAGELQAAIDEEAKRQAEAQVWKILELVGASVGVLVNFGSAVSSLSKMVTTVTNFYVDKLGVNSVPEALTQMWWQGFDEIKVDLAGFMKSKEWEGLSKDGKSFMTSATDLLAKASAVSELGKRAAAQKKVKFDLTEVDVQARVLIVDTAKLELRKQRNAFMAYIYDFVERFEVARKWKHLFKDYFDTCEARFDLLAHLADLQAERSELEQRRDQCERNLAHLRAQLERLDFDVPKALSLATLETLETRLQLAMDRAVRDIEEEARAFRIWTLADYPLSTLGRNPDAEAVRSQLHEPLWTEIKERLMKQFPVASDASCRVSWRREERPEEFGRLDAEGVIRLELPISPQDTAEVYFERIKDVKVYLEGAGVEEGSAVFCKLVHPGVSDFARRDRTVVTCYQQPHGIEVSYVESAGRLDYGARVTQPFDVPADPARIRYSPYTTWELHVPTAGAGGLGSTKYNRGLRRESIRAVHLAFELYHSRHGLQGAAPRAAEARPTLVPPTA